MPEDVEPGAYFRLQSSMLSPKMSLRAPTLSSSRIKSANVIHDLASMMKAAPTETDLVMSLAARIQLDGGLPGADEESRVLKSLVAYVILNAYNDNDVFSPHLKKLRTFVEASMKGLNAETSDKIRKVLEKIDEGAFIERKKVDFAVWKIDGQANELKKILDKFLK